MMGHKPVSVMSVIMKATGVPEKQIKGLKWFRCPDCPPQPPRDHQSEDDAAELGAGVQQVMGQHRTPSMTHTPSSWGGWIIAPVSIEPEHRAPAAQEHRSVSAPYHPSRPNRPPTTNQPAIVGNAPCSTELCWMAAVVTGTTSILFPFSTTNCQQEKVRRR